MTTGLLITTVGQAAIAADLAGGANLVLTNVVFGDANGVPYNPNVAQQWLVNERYIAPIASVAVLGNEIIVDAIIPADTPDAYGRPSHGFNIAECALTGLSGTTPIVVGVARMGNGYKPPPSSGQAAIATFRLKLAVANPAAIAVVIDPQAQILVGRHVRPFWMTVDGVLNAPPANPAAGATYVIGSAPTGAWAGFAGRLAQWVGVWSLATVPEGHVVCDTSQSLDSASRFMRRSGSGWVAAEATESAYGFTRLASSAEALAGAAGRALSPQRADEVFARRSRLITAGSGLIGGGSLVADRALSIDYALLDSRYTVAGPLIASMVFDTTASVWGGQQVVVGTPSGGTWDPVTSTFTFTSPRPNTSYFIEGFGFASRHVFNGGTGEYVTVVEPIETADILAKNLGSFAMRPLVATGTDAANSRFMRKLFYLRVYGY